MRIKPKINQRDYSKADEGDQAKQNIEGAMRDLGTVPDPDMSGGWGHQENENWRYKDEDEYDPTPGRIS